MKKSILILSCLLGPAAFAAPENREFDAKGLNEISVENISGKVTASSTGDAKVTVGVSKNKFSSECKMTLNQDGGKLVIKVEKSKSFSNEECDVDFDLKVPKSVERVQLHVISGAIHLGSLPVKSLKVEVISGDVQADVSKADEVRMKSVSGNLDADLGKKPQASIEVVSGNITLKARKALNAKVTAKTVSGDIKIEGKQVEGDEPVGRHFARTFGKGEGSIDVKTVSGDLTLDLN